MSNGRTWFDSLPSDALAELVKKMEPRTEQPLQLFALSNPFRVVAPLAFRHLNVVIGGKLRCNPVNGELTVDEYADVDLVSNHALEACGPDSFTTIKIMAEKEATRHFPLFRHPDGKLGSFLTKFCRRGARSIVQRADKVIYDAGIALNQNERALSASARSRFDRFAECVSTFRQLKTLSYTGNNIRALNRVWHQLGTSLECIELVSVDEENDIEAGDASRWATCIELLHEHCRKLNSIRLWRPVEDDEEDSEERFVSFLTSYGSQLASDWISLSDVSASSCARIAKICCNLRCDAVCVVDSFDRLAALNQNVVSVTFWLDSKEDWSPIAVAMESARLVSALVVEPDDGFATDAGVPEEFVKNMFRPKLGTLDYLVIERFMSPHCLSYITASTSQLKEIHLSFTTLETVDLSRLVRARLFLEPVYIEEGTKVYHDDKTAIKIATNLVSMLASAQKMEEIEIQFFYRKVKQIFGDMLSSFRIKSNLHILISFSCNKFGRP